MKKNTKNSDIDEIRKLESAVKMQIPLVLNRVQAGFPSPAQDEVDKRLDMNEHLIRNEHATFIVRVNSQSMIGVGIDVNDELIVDRSLNPKSGDIVIALIDDEFTLKRLIIENNETWLKAENSEYPDIHFNDGQQMMIWGVVTRCIKNFR